MAVTVRARGVWPLGSFELELRPLTVVYGGTRAERFCLAQAVVSAINLLGTGRVEGGCDRERAVTLALLDLFLSKCAEGSEVEVEAETAQNGGRVRARYWQSGKEEGWSVEGAASDDACAVLANDVYACFGFPEDVESGLQWFIRAGGPWRLGGTLAALGVERVDLTWDGRLATVGATVRGARREAEVEYSYGESRAELAGMDVRVPEALRDVVETVCIAKALAGGCKYVALVDPLVAAPLEAHAALAAELVRAACSGKYVLVTLSESMHHVLAALLSEGAASGIVAAYALRGGTLVRVRRPEEVTGPQRDVLEHVRRELDAEWLARVERLYAAHASGSGVALRDALETFMRNPCMASRTFRAVLYFALLSRLLLRDALSR